MRYMVLSVKVFLGLLTALSTLANAPATAQFKLEGHFIAFEACEAYQSKNKLTNPGNVLTIPRHAYDAVGQNKSNGDFFLVRIPGAPVTEDRWISASCGKHVVASQFNPAQPESPIPSSALPITNGGTESTQNLLTLSWQPAFCETRPSKTECLDLNAGLLPAASQQLSIHGLWPQPRGKEYCGVSSPVRARDTPATWHQLPAPQLDLDTADELSVLMPGTASHLHHHEWIKHGTCYFGAGGSDEYYDDTLYLTSLINGSAAVDLLTANVGRQLTATAIRNAFDEAFGGGAGERVTIKCTNDGSRILLTELWFYLSGEIDEESSLGDLLRAAPTAPAGCLDVLIDPAGLQ
ncbi:ribonuclease T2 family protein [Roseibium sp.]|uniref:ribonuclease T2 family protein n=1 Tax=Roseibium sp. TaxID=1936156 RepID=UPI003A9788AB